MSRRTSQRKPKLSQRRSIRLDDLPPGMREQAARKLRAQMGVEEWKIQDRANKFGAKSFRDENGDWWDSESEYKRWLELQQLERAGEIRNLRAKVAYNFGLVTYDDAGKQRREWLVIRSKGYPNGRKVKYIADFVYIDCRRERGRAGVMVVEDRKGFQTQESKLKIALMELFYGVRVEITRAPK